MNKKLSKDAEEVLNIINNAYAGIASRSNLEMEWQGGGDSKRLSRALAELRRKNLIKTFRSTEPSDRFIYETTERIKGEGK